MKDFLNWPVAAWLAACVVSLLLASSFHLDDNSADQDAAADAIKQLNREQRLSKAGKAICGENAAWQVEGNTLQCFTHRGKKTITATVQP